MQDTVLYMRGKFPFGADLRVPTQMKRAATAVLELEEAQLTRIVADLDECQGFLDPEAVHTIVAAHVRDQEQIPRLVMAIVGLDEFSRNAGLSIEELHSRLEASLKGEKDPALHLPQAALEEFHRRLPLIIKRYPGRDRQVKAQQLSLATGLPLEEAGIVCDLRPVFDVPHKAVEGMIPYTILKVVCKGVDGLPVHLEATLSYAQVERLAKAASDALEKLQVLGNLLGEKGIAVPSVDLTRRED